MVFKIEEIELEKDIKKKREVITVDDMNLPEKPGLAPQIDWGKDFDAFDDAGKIRYLKKLCSALNHSADMVQKERDQWLQKCHDLSEQLKNSDSNVTIRKEIYTKAITDFNEEKQKLIKRLQELEREVRIRDEILKSYGHNLD
jgi:hypothetical protein